MSVQYHSQDLPTDVLLRQASYPIFKIAMYICIESSTFTFDTMTHSFYIYACKCVNLDDALKMDFLVKLTNDAI